MGASVGCSQPLVSRPRAPAHRQQHGRPPHQQVRPQRRLAALEPVRIDEAYRVKTVAEKDVVSKAAGRHGGVRRRLTQLACPGGKAIQQARLKGLSPKDGPLFPRNSGSHETPCVSTLTAEQPAHQAAQRPGASQADSALRKSCNRRQLTKWTFSD